MQHVVFHDGSAHTEGLGAKWREFKYGIWLALRLNWLLLADSDGHNSSVAWVPNPAMAQNPHISHRSMMGAIGIIGGGEPVLRRSPSWLLGAIRAGEYQKAPPLLPPRSLPATSCEPHHLRPATGYNRSRGIRLGGCRPSHRPRDGVNPGDGGPCQDPLGDPTSRAVLHEHLGAARVARRVGALAARRLRLSPAASRRSRHRTRRAAAPTRRGEEPLPRLDPHPRVCPSARCSRAHGFLHPSLT